MVKAVDILLDANVLMALGWSTHEHHAAAHAWLKQRKHRRWATCPLTQLAFVRLSCNPSVVDPVATPQQATALLRVMTSRTDHAFWTDTVDLATEPTWPEPWVVGHRQVPDARLVLLAKRHSGKLATFDRPLAKAGGALVELIAR